jgi:hypothetical protein
MAWPEMLMLLVFVCACDDKENDGGSGRSLVAVRLKDAPTHIHAMDFIFDDSASASITVAV